MEEDKTLKTGEKPVIRDTKGHFLPGSRGNPKGRPKKNEPLQDALKAYEAEHDVSFLKTYFETALKDKATMRDLAGRLYPTLKAVDGSMVLSGQVVLLPPIINIEPVKDDNVKDGPT